MRRKPREADYETEKLHVRNTLLTVTVTTYVTPAFSGACGMMITPPRHFK
jgi:hypothetical protein